jgi:integrase
MLQIPDVRRWYENLARGSPNTAEVRIRRLSHFCKMNNTTPLGLVELGKTDRKGLEDLLQDHISMMEKNGSSPGYIDCTVKAVRSWLNHNEIELKRRIKIANRDFTPTLQNERVPTKEELQYLLIHADDRAKVAMSLVAMSGLRLETLGTFDASDGLVVGDLPELHVEKKSVSFIKIPTLVTVRREVSKTSHKYFTFLPKQGCDYLTRAR